MIAKSVNKTTFLLHNFSVFPAKLEKLLSTLRHEREESFAKIFSWIFSDGQRRKIFLHYDAEGAGRQEMAGNKKAGELVTDGRGVRSRPWLRYPFRVSQLSSCQDFLRTHFIFQACFSPFFKWKVCCVTNIWKWRIFAKHFKRNSFEDFMSFWAIISTNKIYV